MTLEKSEFEKKWTEIIESVGAKVVDSSEIDRKDTKLDIIMVDSMCMPPHATAIAPRVSKILNRASSCQPKAVIVDLSWATQCIVQRRLLETDDDRRYRVDMSASDSRNKNGIVDIYCIKVKQFNGMTRYEVGDSVNFGKSDAKLSHGRIIAIKHNSKLRKNTVQVKILELHNKCELMDGGKGASSVTIDETELKGHTVLLGGKDYNDVAWSKASNVFRQKKV